MSSAIPARRTTHAARRRADGRIALARAAALHPAAAAALETLEPRRLLATTFTVTTTADVVDAADGVLSLREAIVAANNLVNVGGPDRIEFNIGGGGPQTIRPVGAMLPSILSGVIIDGRTQPGYAGKPIIQISGELAPANADGLRVGSLASRISGLVISRFGAQGMQITALANQNVVFGCYFGTELDGVTPAPNARGILLSGFNNVIGGATAEDRNVISGNTGDGIAINGTAANDNRVTGNFIGTDATGTIALGNRAGVFIANGAKRNFVGTNGDGTNDATEGNVISANREIGVRLNNLNTSQNVVAGNLIGTDVTGTLPMGNVSAGVFLFDRPTSNRIGTNNNGTSDALERNVISDTRTTAAGAFGEGIKIFSSGTNFNTVAGNYIGTDITGTLDLGNASWGVSVQQGSVNQIGLDADNTPDASEGNLISGNNGGGVQVTDSAANSNSVTGNLIGTDASGAAPLGNSGPGVRIEAGAVFNFVQRNAIAYNTAAGVALSPATGTNVPYYASIRFNAIHDNGGLGIDLGNDGVTPNDFLDADDGPNARQNAPVIDSFTALGPSELEVTGRVFARPYSYFDFDLYATPAGAPGDIAEGARYLGTTYAYSDDIGHASFSIVLSAALAPGEIVTATATDFYNTSEFSSRVTADPGGPYVFYEGEGSAGVREVQLSGFALDLGGDAVTYAWDLDNDGAFDDSTDLEPTLTFDDDGPVSQVVSLRVVNSAGQTSVGTTAVRIYNQSPSLLEIASDSTESNPTEPGQPTIVSGRFTDPGLLDTHTLVVDWGDGTVENLAAPRPAGSVDGDFSLSHAFATGGIYYVSVNVIDDDGSASGFAYVPVYVTGAGIQFGQLNIVGTPKADVLTLTGGADGSLDVAASFLTAPLHFAPGEFYAVSVYLGGKSDRATAVGPVYGLSVSGGDGNDVLTAGEYSAYLYGGPGNDHLIGGPAYDVLYGGDGNDVLDAGTAFDPSFTDYLYGEAGNDSMIGRNGSAQADGGSGHDTFVTSSESQSYFYGQEGNDKATGGSAPDIFYGGPGNDLLDGRGGDDNLFGEAGNDTTLGGSGNDYLFGGTESDRMEGGDGGDGYYFETAYNAATSPEADSIVESGSIAENTLSFYYLFDSTDGVIVDLGRSGAGVAYHRNGSRTVSITGSASFGWLIGGWGDDLLTGNAADNYIDGNEGNNVIYGGAGNDHLFGGGGGQNELHGGTGNDELFGGYGHDQLFGDEGDDTLYGNSGADTIDGGADTDTLGDPGDPDDILTSVELP